MYEKNILDEISKRKHYLSNVSKTATKFTIIRKILGEIIDVLPQDTKLPPLRTIADLLNTTIIPLQRAINDLVTAGRLYTQPRSGVFVNHRITSPSNDTGSGNEYFRIIEPHQVSFSTDSGTHYQIDFWEKSFNLFYQSNKDIIIKLIVKKDSPDNEKECDFFERSGWCNRWQKESQYLMLDKYISPSLSAVKKYIICDHFLPISYRSFYVFFNQDLLEKYNMPYPTYTDFQGQLAFFKKTHIMSLEKGFLPPISFQQPPLLLGSVINDIIDLAMKKEESNSSIDSFIGIFSKLIELCSFNRYVIDSAHSDNVLNDFINSKSILHNGYSVDYWHLLSEKLSFNWQAYPIFNADDEFIVWPICLAINNSTKMPFECIRVASHLLSKQQQQLLFKHGEIPVIDVEYEIPKCAMNAKEYSSFVNSSRPVTIFDRDMYYIVFNIIGGEIFQILNHQKNIENGIADLLSMIKAYNSHHIK